MSEKKPYWAPNLPPPPPRQPKPGERIWETHGDQVTWSCEFRDHGEGYGCEAQILRDGDLIIGRHFASREVAIRWAAAARGNLEADGRRSRTSTNDASRPSHLFALAVDIGPCLATRLPPAGEKKTRKQRPKRTEGNGV